MIEDAPKASGEPRAVTVDAPRPKKTTSGFAHRLVSSVPYLIVACGLLGGSVLRFAAIFSKHQMEHDEVVTYLAATGHMGAFEQAVHGGLAGRWVPAAAWKNLLSPGPFWSFGRIASGLAHYDEHPPLYFWLLHVWIALFGLTLHVGAVLNVLIAAITCLCLFGFACYVLSSRLQAAVVALAWAFSPATIETTAMARHYDLFALVTVLCLWLFALCTDSRKVLSWRLLLLLGLATAAGMLTHYQFALVLVAGGGLALFRLVRTSRRRLLLIAAAVGAGLLVSVAFNPLFYVAIGNQRSAQVHAPNVHDFVLRVEDAALGVVRFFVIDSRGAQGRVVSADISRLNSAGHLRYVAVLAAVTLAVLVAGLLLNKRSRRWLAQRIRTIDPGSAVVLYYLLAVGGMTIGLYLAFQSPIYAMAPRYLAAVWPFMAFVPVLVGRLVGRRVVAVALVICLVVVVPSGIQRAFVGRISSPKLEEFATARRVFMWNEARGDLLRVIWETPARVGVFVLPQDQSYRDPAVWVDGLRAGDLYLPVSGPIQPKLRTHVRSVLAQYFTLVPLKGRPQGAVTWYRLEPLSRTGNASLP
jgi:uncharacterized membrane protein